MLQDSPHDDETDALSVIFRHIEQDAGSVFPDLKIFQPNGPLHDDLVMLTKAYAFYRSDQGYLFGTHSVGATLLMNLNPFESFVALVNVFNRPLPLSFLIRDAISVRPVHGNLTLETQVLHHV